MQRAPRDRAGDPDEIRLREARNLAGALPDKAKELRDNLAAWRTRVGAQMPTANPNYVPK